MGLDEALTTRAQVVKHFWAYVKEKVLAAGYDFAAAVAEPGKGSSGECTQPHRAALPWDCGPQCAELCQILKRAACKHASCLCRGCRTPSPRRPCMRMQLCAA